MRNRHAISSAARAVSLAVAVAAFAALAAGCPPRLFTYEKEYVVSFESGLKEFERREFPLDKITLYTFPLCEWEKPDSVFGGWAEELDGSTDGSARYQPGEHIMVERNMRFVAVWEFELRIFYDGDDSDKGRAPVDELVYVEYEQATVQGNTRSLQKTGYTFSGWTGVSPSSGSLPDDSWTVSPYQPYRADVVYREGDTFLITGNVTLYPYWEEGRFWLSYDKNGADSGGTPTDSAKYGAGDWAVAADAPEGMTRAGYVFNGWNTKPDGTGKPYRVNASVPINADTVLYAQWKKLYTYTLSYDKNGADSGNAPTDGTNYGAGDWAVAADAPEGMTRAGYVFNGWNTKPDGTGKDYPAGAPVPMTADTALYARWSKMPYVSYQPNGYSPAGMPLGSTEYRPGEAVKVPDFSFRDDVRVIYFYAWNTELDGSGRTYYSGDTFAVWDDITLYAQWKPLYRVWYAKDADEFAEKDQYGTYLPNEQVTVRGDDTIPNSPAGRYFAAWSMKPNGAGEWYQEGETFSITRDTTFYPVWADFAGEPGTGASSIEVILAYQGEHLATLTGNTKTGIPLPSAQGLISIQDTDVVTWNTTPDGSGLDFEPGYVIKQSQILYAKIWTTYTVSYAIKNTYQDEDGDAVPVPIPAVTRHRAGAKVRAAGVPLSGTWVFVNGDTGCKFGGWRVLLRTLVNGKEQLSELSPPVTAPAGGTFIMPAGDVVLEDKIV